MNQQKLRADTHKQIEKIFKTLLPARGLSYREAQAQLSHTMLGSNTRLLRALLRICSNISLASSGGKRLQNA